MSKITDASIEKVLDWLQENATKAAQSRATRIYLEEARKSLKATLMAEHKDLPLGAQEREAYRDQRYLDHLEAMRTAVEEDEKARWLMVTAQARIEAWRSIQANQRTQGRIG